MDKGDSNLISYAIGTEIDSINTYQFLINHLPPECHAKIKHILDEEKEHVIELIELLKGNYDA